MSRITDLFVHPLKGAAPQRVQRLVLDALGAVGDRRWVLVDADGQQLTARETPRLLHVRATLPMRDGAISAEAPLALTYDAPTPWLPPLFVPHASATAARLAVRVWDDEVVLADAGDEAAAWCTDAVGVACRLMHWCAESHRPLRAKYAGPLPTSGRDVAATDGAPLLLLGAASLDALNHQLAAHGSPPLGLERFRPNIVLATQAPHEEDRWARVRLGDVLLGVGTPCPRCVVTTIDPATLERGVEPLRTLATYRRGPEGSVLFGVNATPAEAGSVGVGDELGVLAFKEPSN
jgi:uncharacterized protein YcbX